MSLVLDCLVPALATILSCSLNVSYAVRIRWSSAQSQILHGNSDGEMVKALPAVSRQTEGTVQHIVEAPQMDVSDLVRVGNVVSFTVTVALAIVP